MIFDIVTFITYSDDDLKEKNIGSHNQIHDELKKNFPCYDCRTVLILSFYSLLVLRLEMNFLKSNYISFNLLGNVFYYLFVRKLQD